VSRASWPGAKRSCGRLYARVSHRGLRGVQHAGLDGAVVRQLLAQVFRLALAFRTLGAQRGVELLLLLVEQVPGLRPELPVGLSSLVHDRRGCHADPSAGRSLNLARLLAEAS